MVISNEITESEKVNLIESLTNYCNADEILIYASRYEGAFGNHGYVALSDRRLFQVNKKFEISPKIQIELSSILSVEKIAGMLEVSYFDGKRARKYVINILQIDFLEMVSNLEKHSEIRREEKESVIAQENQDLIVSRGNYIGTIKRDLFNSGGTAIEVYEKMIVQGSLQYKIDGYVSAEVTLSGQVQVAHRPTLTRMGLLSPLPGISLIAGLALPKKSSHDSREVHVSISHPEWSCSVRTHYSGLANAKELANRINKISERFLEENRNSKIPSDGSDSRIEQLMKIKELLDSGLISKSDADKLKSEII